MSIRFAGTIVSLAAVILPAAAPATSAQSRPSRQIAPSPASVRWPGRVVSSHGRALEGTEVVVFGIPASQRTGPDGRFDFDGIAPGDYLVVARHLGFETALFSTTIRETPGTPLRIVLDPLATRLPDGALAEPRYAFLPSGYEPLARRLDGGNSKILSTERLGQFTDLEGILATLPAARKGSCWSTAFMPSGPAPVGHVMSEESERASEERFRWVHLEQSDYLSRSGMRDTAGVGIDTSVLPPSAQPLPSSAPRSASAVRPGFSGRGFVALEYIPPEVITATYPDEKSGCGAAILWR